MSESVSHSQVMDSLEEVLDPCSCFTDHPVNIVELGLVEDVVIDDGTAHVSLLLTTLVCNYFLDMSNEIENRLLELEGIQSVTVEQETDQIWTDERMDDELRKERRERFEQEMEQHGITPQR